MRKLVASFLIVGLCGNLFAADITISFDNALVPRILTAFENVYGWKANIPDPGNPGQTIPNPETRAQFAKRMLARYVREVVIANESAVAAEAARQAARQASEAEIIVQ